MNHWLASGTLQPQIDRVLPLSKTAEAHRLQEQSTVQRSRSARHESCLPDPWLSQAPHQSIEHSHSQDHDQK
ncbi:MAG: zinc-binding dehydrogenase [Pirellulales bacterium]